MLAAASTSSTFHIEHPICAKIDEIVKHLLVWLWDLACVRERRMNFGDEPMVYDG